MATKVKIQTKLTSNKKKTGVNKRKYNKHSPKPKLYRGQGR